MSIGPASRIGVQPRAFPAFSGLNLLLHFDPDSPNLVLQLHPDIAWEVPITAARIQPVQHLLNSSEVARVLQRIQNRLDTSTQRLSHRKRLLTGLNEILNDYSV